MGDIHEQAPLVARSISTDDANTGNTGVGLHTPDYGSLGVSRQESERNASRGASKMAAVCILFMELGERLTFYSVAANLVPLCTSVLKFTNGAALSITMAFTGVCYVVPVFGGWVADSVAGRFNTIYGSSLFYLVGVALLPAVAIDFVDIFGYGMSLGAHRGYFFVALVLIAVGTGGIKSNVSPFGAKQVENEGTAFVNSFFNWFYWFVNLGSFLAFTLVAYVQQQKGFPLGYTITAVSMLLAVIIFLIPRSKYLDHRPQGSVLGVLIRVVYDGVRLRWSSEDKACGVLDSARMSTGGPHPDSLVNTVQCVVRQLPVLACFIVYFMILLQSSGQYILQAEVMDLRLGSFTIPAASLNTFDSIIIMLLVPILDRLVYPRLDKINRKPTQLQRIGIGMVLTIFSLIASVVLEILRKDEVRRTGGFPQEVAGTTYNASHLTVLWQVPQFALLGAGEVFTSITGIEICYLETPRHLQGIMMGVFLLTSGLGSFLGSALVAIVNAATSPDQWIPAENINVGHTEYYYLLSAALLLVNFIIFLVVARNYTYCRLGAVTEEGHAVDTGQTVPTGDVDQSDGSGHSVPEDTC